MALRIGFSALVNYDQLDRRTLEKLTYTYLGPRPGLSDSEPRCATAWLVPRLG